MSAEDEPTEIRTRENGREKRKTCINNLTTEYTHQTWHARGPRRPFSGTFLVLCTALQPPEFFDMFRHTPPIPVKARG